MRHEQNQNVHHIADDILKFMFLNEKDVCVLFQIGLKFIPGDTIDKKTLSGRICTKPLPETLMALFTVVSIYVAKSQWIDKHSMMVMK